MSFYGWAFGASVMLVTVLGMATVVGAQPTAPSARSSPSAFRVPYDAVTEHRFDNGLRLVVVEDPTQPLVDIAAALDVGGRLETVPVGARREWPPGVASFVASMLTRGGVGSLDGFTLAVQTEFRGAEVRSFGGRNRSGVLASGLAEHLDELVQWVAAALSSPRFEVGDLERYRSNALRSLEGRYRTTGSIADREWQALVFGAAHPRARPLRTIDVEAWSPEAVKSFHAAFYRPERTVIAVAGDVDADTVVEAFGRRLGTWGRTQEASTTEEPSPGSAGSGEREVRGAWTPREVRSSPPGFYQFVVPAAQGTFVVGHLGAQRDSWEDREADAVALLSEILAGGGPVSRLRGRLRDREGWVYGVSGSIGVGSIEPGLFQAAWSVAPENAVASLEAALEEIERLRRLEPPAQEIAVARRTMVEVLPSLFDTAEEIAGRYAEDLLLGRPHAFWTERAARLSAVDAGDIQRAARKWLRTEDLIVVWVGPELPSSQIRRLGLARVVNLPARDPRTLRPIR